MSISALVLAKQMPATVTGDLHTLLENGLWIVLMVCGTALIGAAGGVMWAKHTGRTLFFASAAVVKALVAAVAASSCLLFATNFLFAVNN